MKKNIAVFAGRNCVEERHDHYFGLAYRLGKLLAEAGYVVITGAGPGLMDECLKGAVENKGETIGVCLHREGRKHSDYQTKTFMFEQLGPRQKKIVELADAYIALPGGIGTLYEISEILALKNAEEMPMEKPLILLDSFYDMLSSTLQEMKHEGFITKNLHDYYSTAKKPEEAIEILSRELK